MRYVEITRILAIFKVHANIKFKTCECYNRPLDYIFESASLIFKTKTSCLIFVNTLASTIVVFFLVERFLLFSKVRDLLLWQDVYVGEGGSLQSGKESSAGVTGYSREGSENGGENALAEEIDKLQVSSMDFRYI